MTKEIRVEADKCPRCGSTNLSGTFIHYVCLDCGYNFAV